MPALTFDRFEGGLDVRPARALANAKILRGLTNAYISTGRSIRKRPCLELIATLEAGTVGLKTIGTKLATFYGTGAAITHADTRFQAYRVPHWTTGAAPTKIHFCDAFNALPYIVAEYAGPVYRHHYLDGGSTASPTWAALTVYAANAFVVPTTQNGFRYEVTAGGGGASGGAEPAWPTTIGSTVVNGALTFTCRTFAITDTNCPHTKPVTKRQQKMYAASGSNVRFCKTGDVRDWTAASDAGFLPAGLQATGSDQVTAVGQFQSNLAVFFSDSLQVWVVDPDPANNALTGSVENVGTIFPKSPRAMAGDLFFLAQNGFRSVSLLALTNNLQDQDVGTGIDKIVKPSFVSTDDPISIYYPKLGQWWCLNGDEAWVYSFSRTSKLSAWSKFTFDISIDDATILDQELYVRSGDNVYKVSTDVYKDGTSSTPLVDIEMYFQDAQKPGVLKQWWGVDVIGTGTPTISFLFDAADETLESQEYEYPAVTEPGTLNPVELCSTRIAPHIQHQIDEELEISLITLYYEDLGVR